MSKKPEFNPDKPYDVVKPSFDESQPFEETPTSLGESTLRGAAQGATFGFAPAISGAAEASPEVINAVTGEGSMAKLLDTYRKARDESQRKFDKAQKDNPKAFFAGSMAGSLAPALLTGGASEEGSLAQGLSGLTRGIIAPSTAAGALTGAGYGALSGAGKAVSSGEDSSQALGEIGKGLAGGALLGGTVSKIGNTISSKLGPEALSQSANERALKATGISKSQIKNMLKQDIGANKYAASTGLEAPESSVDKIGSLLLKKNPYQETPVITSGSTPEVILERAQDLAQKSGSDIGNILKQLDQTYSEDNPSIVGKFFNPAKSAQEVESQLLNPLKVNGEVSPVAKGTASTIQNVLDTINQYGNNPIPFEKAQELKSLISNMANYESEGSANNQILRKVSGILNKDIETAADDVSSSSNKPDLLDRYKKAKDLYKTAMTTTQAATGKVASNMANNTFGLTDYMSGLAGAAVHGTPTGILAAAGSKLAKTYGNTAMAAGAKGTSEILSGMNSALVEAPKQSLATLGNSFISSGDPIKKSLGNILVKAADRDDIGRNALIFSLMQNSGYRDLLRKYMGDKETKE